MTRGSTRRMVKQARTVFAVAVVAGVTAAAQLVAQQAARAPARDAEIKLGAIDVSKPEIRALDAQLGRVFGGEYTAPRFGPARWLAEGGSYTTVERSTATAGGWDIIRYDGATGTRSVLVAASRLVPSAAAAASRDKAASAKKANGSNGSNGASGSGASTGAHASPSTANGAPKPLEIDDYAWSADGRRLLVFTNTERVWRQNTRGDYWVLDLDSGRLHQLGGREAPVSSLMFAKFSPDATRAAYVRGNNLYVERLDDGRVTQLTKDGSETTINGTSDWVYEEELNVRDGFRWSPDGRAIAYWQFDSTGVGTFTLIDDTSALYPTLTRIPYPKVGTTNSAVRIGVVDAGGGKTRWMKTPGAPRDTYLARLDWIDAGTVAIQQLNRLQNRNDFLLADTRTGDVKSVFHDESKTWVDVVEEVPWIDKGRAFLWMSERDGWQHVFRVPREGGTGTLITKFDADVTDIVGLDEAKGVLYFLASPDNATQRYLYRSAIDGSGAPVRVTPSDQPGTHSYTLAPDAKLAFHTYSRIDQPPVTDVVDLATHRSVRALTDTSALVARLAPVMKPSTEFFKVDIGGGVTLDGWMLKPSTFDPARKYPVIAYVYGEPAGQTVIDRWVGSRQLFHRALAEAGYIVLSLDNRGTPAPRGAAWRKVVHGAVGDLSLKDQAAAIRALVAQHAFIDRDRVGIWGWSGGGSSTLHGMFRFPDVYRVGVSVAPVPDQALYDTIYQERYMGLPKDNAEGYRIGSPINFAQGLKGHLLIVHGSGDDNVHYQGTERLVNKLIELGKPFDLMVYPNRTHAIAEGPGTTAHIYRLIARYFVDHLPPGPR